MNEVIWNPTIEVVSHAGVREVSLMTKHLMNRNIFLTGEICMDKAMSILSQLKYLAGESDEEINLYINSGGGEVNAGFLIYDLLQDIKAPVNIYCTGFAASMAAVILAGGQKGRRFILPHSKTMIHEPLLSNGVGGSASSIKHISDSIIETRTILNGILAKHTGKSLKEINKATAFDNYMNAEESVAFGLCDAVVEGIF